MTPTVRQVLTARLAVARVTKGKTEAVLRRTCADGRLRGILAYHGAHTGRWAGRGFQPQNLTRPVSGVDYGMVHNQLDLLHGDAEAEAEAEAATAFLRTICELHGCSMGGLLSSLLRGVIVSRTGKLAACDYSAIEARVILWLAGDTAGLDIYRRYDAEGGPDPYERMGAEIYSIPADDVTKQQRLAAKVASLACQYGGSVGAFDAMAKTYGLDASQLDVRSIVDAWRDTRHIIAGTRRGGFANDEGEWVITRNGGLWKDLDRTAKLAVSAPGGVFTSGRCTWSMQGGPHMICTLPSGRPIVYRDMRLEPVLNKWGKSPLTLTFFGKIKNSSRWGRVETRGQVLSENITQAVARDLMADAMVQIEALPGIDTVLTVHDELLCEVDGEARLSDISAAMLNAPAWASGLPLAVEGACGSRYGKA